MAWRLRDSIVRGELDNREHGIVRGRLWINGFADPVTLELTGNACPDLAGCELKFHNPGTTVPLETNTPFSLNQRGKLGDLTASRRIRVPEVSLGECFRLRGLGLRPPEHWANSLFLEWFSETDGRVVVESTDYVLSISQGTWRLSPQEEREYRRHMSQGFTGFLKKISAAIEASRARREPADLLPGSESPEPGFVRESDLGTSGPAPS
jgi:hypothetical protein